MEVQAVGFAYLRIQAASSGAKNALLIENDALEQDDIP